MILRKIFKKKKPLFFDYFGSLILAKNHKIYVLDSDLKPSYLLSLPCGFFERIFSIFFIFVRLSRLGVSAAASYGSDYYFCFNSNIYRYNLDNNELVLEFSFTKGRGPLSFSVIEGISGFQDSIYFGEYFSNHAKEPVSIYRRSSRGTWENIYTFETCEINHIHSLVPDPFRGCVWVLVGDFGDAAGIWVARGTFDDLSPVLRGDQNYRACVAYPVEDGLLYATDTQIVQNSLRFLKNIDGLWSSEEVIGLNGSCIYGCELKDYYVFSTATEPSDKSKNFLIGLFDTRPGPGILKNQSDVLALNKKTGEIELLYSRQKDFLPYRLFQFGAIMFPAGKNDSNTLVSYSVANKVNDLSTEVLDI